MKLKILILYVTALFMLFLSSCSEITDSASKELRAGSWQSKSNSGSSFSLKFKGDDAEITIKDPNNKKTIITGTTIVTDDSLSIYDSNTLNEYHFKYQNLGSKIILENRGKKLELTSVH